MYHQLSTVDGFVVIDGPGVPASGLVRSAKKILRRTALMLARSATYSFATFEVQRMGASGALHCQPADIQSDYQAFVTEVANKFQQLHLYPGKGFPTFTTKEMLQRSADFAGDPTMTAATVLASIEWAAGSINRCSVVVEGAGTNPVASEVATALTTAGAAVKPEPDTLDKLWAMDVDVICLGSKPGLLQHPASDQITAKAVVPWGPVPFTTRAFANLHTKNQTKVLPDFISASGNIVAGYLPNEHSFDHVQALLSAKTISALQAGEHAGNGVFLGSCTMAEQYLASWSGFQPFGRPLI